MPEQGSGYVSAPYGQPHVTSLQPFQNVGYPKPGRLYPHPTQLGGGGVVGSVGGGVVVPQSHAVVVVELVVVVVWPQAGGGNFRVEQLVYVHCPFVEPQNVGISQAQAAVVVVLDVDEVEDVELVDEVEEDDVELVDDVETLFRQTQVVVPEYVVEVDVLEVEVVVVGPDVVVVELVEDVEVVALQPDSTDHVFVVEFHTILQPARPPHTP